MNFKTLGFYYPSKFYQVEAILSKATQANYDECFHEPSSDLQSRSKNCERDLSTSDWQEPSRDVIGRKDYEGQFCRGPQHSGVKFSLVKKKTANKLGRKLTLSPH